MGLNTCGPQRMQYAFWPAVNAPSGVRRHPLSGRLRSRVRLLALRPSLRQSLGLLADYAIVRLSSWTQVPVAPAWRAPTTLRTTVCAPTVLNEATRSGCRYAAMLR